MPHVPRQTGPEVELSKQARGYQRSRANPDTFGASIGRGMQQAGSEIEQAGRGFERAARIDEAGAEKLGQVGDQLAEIQDRFDEAAAKEADNAFATQIRETLFNPEGGYYSKKGRNAIDARGGTQEALEKLRKDSAAKLTPNQARMFDEVAQRRLQSEFESMDRYVLAEQRVWENETAEARVENSINDAAVAWNDPTRRKTAVMTGRTEILDMADRNGWSPEVTKLKLAQYDTRFHASVIERMQVEAPEAAAEYLRQNEKEIMPEVVIKLKDSILNADVTIKAQAATDAIFSDAGSLEGQLKQARSKFDGKLEDQIVTRLKERWAEKTDTGIETDQAEWYKLTQMATNDPEAFAKLNLIQYRDKLSDSDFQGLAEKQQKISGSKDYQFEVRSADEVIKDALRNVFQISPDADADLSPQKKEFRARYYREIQERVDLWQKTNSGKKPTAKDIQGIVDEYTLKFAFKTPGTLWGTNTEEMRIGEITTDELPNIVPAEDIGLITDALQRRGIANPSASLIAQTYLKRKFK